MTPYNTHHPHPPACLRISLSVCLPLCLSVGLEVVAIRRRVVLLTGWGQHRKEKHVPLRRRWLGGNLAEDKET